LRNINLLRRHFLPPLAMVEVIAGKGSLYTINEYYVKMPKGSSATGSSNPPAKLSPDRGLRAASTRHRECSEQESAGRHRVDAR
jgi:hypothetical protein